MIHTHRQRRLLLPRLIAAGLVLLIAIAPVSVLGDTVVRLAVTTSTRDSGLTDYLLPVFRDQYGLDVHVIALGTGKALAVARRGDVDAVLVHAPEAEKQFVSAGWADSRRYVMYNHFVLLGPLWNDDRPMPTVLERMQSIAAKGDLFVSRGDSSGTHKKEMRLWEHLGIDPAGDWYLSVGQGMASTLRLADQKRAFVLSDHGTFLALADHLQLQVRAQGGELTHNPYHFLTVNPDRHPHINRDGAEKLAAFLIGAHRTATHRQL